MFMQNPVPSSSQSAGDRPSASEIEGRDADQFISSSPSVRKLIARAELVAPHLRLATIEGEAGSGKHTLAKYLYHLATTVRPELSRSAFNRCDAREWLLDAADPRSISGFTYLDRVDLLAAPGQALLLRILRSIEARPVSGVIVIASSESPVRELALEGRFLSDLAFRLSAVKFAIPPLRERRDDIVPLGKALLDRIRHRYHVAGFTFDTGAIARLLQHSWPGNIRELSSVLECAVLECTNGVIRESDLCISSTPAGANKALDTPQALTLDSAIHKHVNYVLELNHGNKLKAARQLGISRSTLYRMLETSRSARN